MNIKVSRIFSCFTTMCSTSLSSGGGVLQLIFPVPSFAQQEMFLLSSDKEGVLAAEGVIRLNTSLLPRFVFSHILLQYDQSIQYLHIEGCKSWWLPGGCYSVIKRYWQFWAPLFQSSVTASFSFFSI